MLREAMGMGRPWHCWPLPPCHLVTIVIDAVVALGNVDQMEPDPSHTYCISVILPLRHRLSALTQFPLLKK